MKFGKRSDDYAEEKCDECGQAMSLCNVRHFVHVARQRGHSKDDILKVISEELDAEQAGE